MTKRKLQGMQTKKKLLECARKLFRENGYNSVTIDRIITEANSSKGAFYNHFKSKEDLVFHMMSMVDEAYESFLESVTKSENSIEAISSFVKYVLHIMEHELGVEFLSVIYSSQIKDLDAERILISEGRKYYDVLKVLIEEGKAKNQIKQEISAKHTVKILTTCIRGIIYDWCLYKGNFNISEYGMEIVFMILNQIRVNQKEEKE